MSDHGAVLEAIGAASVVPVLTIEEGWSGNRLGAALFAGGLPVIEITLRTGGGLAAIGAAADGPSTVGAGSVMSAPQVHDAVDAGARFIVSPGLSAEVVAAARERDVVVIPGIATATELLEATSLGVDVVKVFPAEVAGGIPLIRALAAVWPRVRFMPTGGVTAANVASYLGLGCVLAVGGSWMVDPAEVSTGDWSAVTARAVAARNAAGRS